MTKEKTTSSPKETTEQVPSESTAAPTEELKTSSVAVGEQLDADDETNKIVSEVIEEGLSQEDIDSLEDLSDGDIDSLVDNLVDGEAETSESEDESSDILEEALKEPLEAKETDELEDILSNRAQKRIDKLTAEKKSTNEENEALKARLAQLEAKIDGIPQKEEVKQDKTITNEQIAKAIEKGIEDGDTSVIVDAMEYIADKVKKETIAQQQEEAAKQNAAVKARQAEWNSLTKEYTPEAYNYESLKSDSDFNLTDTNSMLFKLANHLFETKGYSKMEKGQSRAVREAYSILLERKLEGNKPPKQVKSKTEGLENRLGKEQRKRTVMGGDNSGGEKSKTIVTESNELDDYIKSRSKAKNKKLGVDI